MQFLARLRARHYVLIAFVALVVGVLGLSLLNTAQNAIPVQTVDVFCYIGSEKDGFLSNPIVKDILARDFGINIKFTKMGSIDQAFLTGTQLQDVDCLWPSNTTALEIFREKNQSLYDRGVAKHDVIFNTPIVLYSWTPVVDKLVAQNYITQDAAGNYVTDTITLLRLIVDPPATWKDLGADFLNGSFRIVTTDPVRSNSGNMFYGLFLNMLNGGEVVTGTNVDTYLPILKTYYDQQGLLEESSGILFDRFITLGAGATPLMANYESLIIEYGLQNQASLATIQDQVRIVYPQPTVWSAHPAIALSEEGKAFIEALKSESLQKLGWEQHGFRSAVPGILNDPSIFDLAGIPSQVNSVVNLPNSAAMLKMIEGLEG